MSATVSPEFEQIRATLKKFVEGELIPLQEQRGIDPNEPVPIELFKELAQRSHDLGFWGIEFPIEVGGGGISTLEEVMLREEVMTYGTMFWRCVFPGPEGPSKILLGGTPEQIDKYLKPTVAANMTVAFALTEPGAGSDAQAITTTATRDGDDYVLNGQKHYITNAQNADYAIVFAATEKGRGSQGGISTFIVDQGTPGMNVGRIQNAMGGDNQCELFFEDCRVSKSQMLGEEGRGFKNAMGFLSNGRLGIAARSVGYARRALELGTTHAKNRVAFGSPIADRQAIQWMLADSATEIYAAQQMVRDTAARIDAGDDVRKNIAMCKLFATEMTGRVADRALQIHGGMGYMKDCEVERIYREVRALRIVEGTSEIQRRIIARTLLAEAGA